MSLDKWLKPEDKGKKLKKKKESSIQVKERKGKQAQKQAIEKKSINLTKYRLICPNAKCKYQKTIVKKELTDDDKTCPRCSKRMKVKEV
ncbi:MAG: hypothetical protein ACFFCL_11605 [Promethearchaeota archaeon]